MNAKTFPVIGIHLDLKYLMPSKSYLHLWLRELAGMGINTILLEYEDKFPFRKYPFLAAEGAFTASELHAFLDEARGLGMEVVPLVQTLSHLEFALAHEELADLRELPQVETQINPFNPDALAFVKDLIDEVLEFHGPDRMFHLGADEAWHLGQNPAYARRVADEGPAAIWAEHEKKLIAHVASAGKRPIVWDDIFWREPELAARVDMPRDVVLASWDYSVTDLGPAGKEKLGRVDVYRRHGFDVLAIPCQNWGDLVPQHEHCLKNVEAWAQKARKADMLGVLNSSWTSFHTPLPTHMPYNAATADLFSGRAASISPAWERQWVEEWFGAAADGVPQALRDLSVLWHRSIAGLARPIGVIIYSYMDMVLHYKGGQEERRARGAYPLDWGEVDFCEIQRKKVALLRAEADQDALRHEFAEREERFRQARDVLCRLAREATRHQGEARLIATFAEVKELWTRAARHQVAGGGSAEDLAAELLAIRPRLEAAIKPYYEPESVSRLMRMWWEPPYRALV